MLYNKVINLQEDYPMAFLSEQEFNSYLSVINNISNLSKELDNMPVNLKNIFITNNNIVHYRLRKDGVYEARFHKQGLNIEVFSKDLNVLKQKFIQKLGCNVPVISVKTDKLKLFFQYSDEWLKIKKST